MLDKKVKNKKKYLKINHL